MNDQNDNSTHDDVASIVPAAVRELLAQRGTYRDWLSRLQEIGGQYRNEVADRVRLDYEARLEEVAEELEGHRHGLVSTLEQRRNRLDELAEDFERRSAELEEAELRFQVGEFDDGTWEERRTELTGGMEEIEAELGQARRAVEALENVLDELAGGESSARGPGARQAEPDATAEADATAAPDATAESEGVLAGKGRVGPPPSSSDDSAPGSTRGVADETPPARSRRAADEMPPETSRKDAVRPRETVATPIGSARKGGKDAAADESQEEPPEGSKPEGAEGDQSSSDAYLDELEFLESLSLDDPDSFDAVSRMLEDEEDR